MTRLARRARPQSKGEFMHNVLHFVKMLFLWLIAGLAFLCWLLTAITYGRI